MKKISLSIILITTLSLAVEPDIAWGFDYPIGNRGYDNNGNKIEMDEYLQSYNNSRNEEYNLEKNVGDSNGNNNYRYGTNPGDAWYNANDVGNFYSGAGGKGIHSGEDWNYRVTNDGSGENIFAVADGVIEEISSVGRTYSNRGWKIIIRHKLPDGKFVYSIYLHITSSDNNDGAITTNEDDFSFQEGEKVQKGDVIGKIASNMTSGLASHLHFEIRDKFTSGSVLYTNANGNGYYTHDGGLHTSMSKDNVLRAFDLMRGDGIFDPSDFIDDHRDIYPWIGNGSIISYHGKNADEHQIYSIGSDTYGVDKDITYTHTKFKNIQTLQKQAGFFQWQPNASCEKIKITHTGINSSVDITVGSWGSRTGDKTYKNVTLPFVLGENDFKNNGTDWRVIAITFNNGTRANSPTDWTSTLKATCTNDAITDFTGTIKLNQAIMIGEHKWNGNASIISKHFEDGYNNYYQTGRHLSNPDNWAFGVFHDVTVIEKNQYKPAVFFQWMESDECKELVIDSTLDASEKKVTLETKNWSSNTYSSKKVTLPYIISSENLWNVIKVAFDKPVSKNARVTATCKGLVD